MGIPRWLHLIFVSSLVLFASLITMPSLTYATASAAVIREHSGRLTNESGAAVKGPVNLEILLYRREKGGDPLLPAPLLFNNVSLEDGRFSIRVELSSADSVIVFGARGDAKVWVQILDQSNDRVYPRQKMTGVAEMVTGITRAAEAKARSDEGSTNVATQTVTSSANATGIATSSNTNSNTNLSNFTSTSNTPATDLLVGPPPQPTSSNTPSTATFINSNNAIAMTSTDTATLSATDAGVLTASDTATLTAANTDGLTLNDSATLSATATAPLTGSDTAIQEAITTDISESIATGNDENSLSLNLASTTFVESPLNPEASDARAELGTTGPCRADTVNGGEVRFHTAFTQRPWVFLQAGDDQTSQCQPRLVWRSTEGFGWTSGSNPFAIPSCSCIHWMAVGR